jgi:hypothetical protein
MVHTGVCASGEHILQKQVACLEATCETLREHSQREYAALEKSVAQAFTALQRENAELELIASQWRRCCAEQQWAGIVAHQELVKERARVRELEEKIELMDLLYAEEQRRRQQALASMEAELVLLRSVSVPGPLDTNPDLQPALMEVPAMKSMTCPQIVEPSVVPATENDADDAIESRENTAEVPERRSSAKSNKSRTAKRNQSRGKRLVPSHRTEPRRKSETAPKPSKRESEQRDAQTPVVCSTTAKRRRRVSFSSPADPVSVLEGSSLYEGPGRDCVHPQEPGPAERIVPDRRQKAVDLHFQKAQQGRRKLFSFITQQRLVIAKPRPVPTLTQL